jgi:myo-inositol-1(or 4)-monophosphatase
MLQSTLIKAAEAGAKVIQEYFNGEFKISSKSNINDL